MCLIPIGTHANSFDDEKGKGHTKEYHPFYFVIAFGRSSTMVSAALIAAQTSATKVMNINFENKNDSSIHCDGASAFTTVRDALFPSAARLGCSVHMLRSLEIALTKNSEKNDIHYVTIKRPVYMLKFANSITQLFELMRVFKEIWAKMFEEKQNEIEECEDDKRAMVLEKLLKVLQSFVGKHLFDNLSAKEPFCPSVGSFGQVPDTNLHHHDLF